MDSRRWISKIVDVRVQSLEFRNQFSSLRVAGFTLHAGDLIVEGVQVEDGACDLGPEAEKG